MKQEHFHISYFGIDRVTHSHEELCSRTLGALRVWSGSCLLNWHYTETPSFKALRSLTSWTKFFDRKQYSLAKGIPKEQIFKNRCQRVRIRPILSHKSSHKKKRIRSSDVCGEKGDIRAEFYTRHCISGLNPGARRELGLRKRKWLDAETVSAPIWTVSLQHSHSQSPSPKRQRGEV